jgi:16S rRNA (cytidine1402-2'-O)-methyltransferase
MRKPPESAGTLYVVGTPIGNLDDITSRGLSVLRRADFILCEDTRVTAKLLRHYGIKNPTISYHQHSKLGKIDKVIGLLEQGKELALVSDAGTPGISDPGNKLVEEIISRGLENVKIIPVPGPAAVTACLSICGFPTDSFLFLGFPPAKRKRKKFFQRIAAAATTVIFYESPHRILKSLEDLRQALGEKRKVVVCRELTKKFESIYRGTAEEVADSIKKDKIKGEFVVTIDKENE